MSWELIHDEPSYQVQAKISHYKDSYQLTLESLMPPSTTPHITRISLPKASLKHLGRFIVDELYRD